MVRHEGVTDGDFFEFIDSFRTTHFGGEMERFTHRTASPLIHNVDAGRSDAKAIPTFIFRLDGIKRKRFAQDDIGPTVAIKLQTVRRILPEIIIGLLKTTIRRHICLENIRRIQTNLMAGENRYFGFAEPDFNIIHCKIIATAGTLVVEDRESDYIHSCRHMERSSDEMPRSRHSRRKAVLAIVGRSRFDFAG